MNLGFTGKPPMQTSDNWSDRDLELLQKLLVARAHLKDGDRAGAIRAVESAISLLKDQVNNGQG